MDGLMMHQPGSHRVTHDQLRHASLMSPQARGSRHMPIPHATLVDTIKDAVLLLGWRFGRTDLGTAAGGDQLFGTMRVYRPTEDDPTVRTTLTPTLGFRSSTNSALAIRMVAGMTVFVCDNLSISGDGGFVLSRKSTTGLLDLPALVIEGLRRWSGQVDAYKLDIAAMREVPLTKLDAKALLLDIFRAGVLPRHLLPETATLYLEPKDEHTDLHHPSLWGLSNACTRSAQALRSPQARFNSELAIGRHFGSLLRKGGDARAH